MAWSMPVDGQYASFARVPAPLLGLLAAVLVVFAWSLVRGRLTGLRGGQAWLLLLVAIASLAALLATIATVGPGTPPWDRVLTSALSSSGLVHAVASGLALLFSFPFALAALFALFAWPAAKARWREAYAALLAGPGLAGLVVVLKLAFPRVPPGAQPFFAGPSAFPNDVATLVPMVLLLHAWLAARLRPGKRPFLARWPVILVAAMLAMIMPIAGGQAWLSDSLAGLFLAGLWASVLLMAWHLEAALERPLARTLDLVDAWMQRVVARPGPWLLGLVGLGVFLRIASYWWTPLAVDAFSYGVMGESFLRHGTFTMPWGDVDTFHTAAVPSHHYPPLYPVYLAAFYKLLGFSQSTTHVAAIVSSLAALLVTYLCTRDLYGKMPALLVTAVVAVSPILVQNTGQGYSENLVLLLFVATLWAILKSLEKPWYILPAGILAGLGYLTKSSMGYFFIIAGLGGLAWRLYWKGLKVLRDPAYIAAILAFGSMVVVWAVRNYRLFGSWETSIHISDAYHAALRHPLQWGYLALVTFVFYATVGYLVYLGALAWLPKLARLPKLGSEHDSGLWLALGLPLLLTAAIDACLWLIEKEFFINNVRYLAFVTVPLAWLLVRHVSPGERSVRLAALLTIVLLVVGALFFARPAPSYSQDLANDLAPRVADWESVAFVDNNNHFAYRFYHQLTHDGTRNIQVVLACDTHPLCPADVPRVAALHTTWALVPFYAIDQMPSAYHQVADSIAQGDAAHPTLQTLWHHE